MTTPAQSPLPEEPRSILRPPVEEALRLLRAAFDAAQALSRDAWDFAVEIEQMHSVGLTNTDLRLLLCEGYAIHAAERTSVQRSDRRSFRKLTNLALPSRSCFVLTKKGLQLAARRLNQSTLVAPSRCLPGQCQSLSAGNRPVWDNTLRELRLHKHLVKHFRLPAMNQQAILAALEEEGWPPHIFDPLPPVKNLDSKVRLHDAIKNLNRNQVNPLLSFRGDGNGQGVLWAVRGGIAPAEELP